MDKRVYWLWLQHAFGAGSPKPWSIFNRFKGGIEEFHSGGTPLWNSMRFISEKEARMLYAHTVNEAGLMLETSEKLGHHVLTPECAAYPEALRNIYAPPAVLYYKGEIPDVDSSPAIAVVGARKATERGMNAATNFGYQLAISDAVVVSGGAVGIDSASLKGALRGMGRTVSIIPCGLSNGYLIENFALREKIIEAGALVTEYPMDTGVTKGTFQVRNRLISGFSCGVLIVEAGEKSGALITAKHAKEQSRDVFAFPGEGYPDYDSIENAGSNSLIKDGAKAVISADEILVEYRQRFRSRKTDKKAEKNIEKINQPMISVVPAMPMAAAVFSEAEDDASLSEDAKKILHALSAEPKHISEIETATGIPTSKLLGSITELELVGKIKTHSGRRYSL